MTSFRSEIKVYTTGPHNCSYLPGREATTLFLDPGAAVDEQLYSRLSQQGFRRSGPHLYRPHCTHCKACIPARIVVDGFQPRRSQKRTWQQNRDLVVSEVKSIADGEYFELYRRYIENRHRGGDMYPPLRDQYESFLTNEWGVTSYFSMVLRGQLLCVSVVDRLDDGLSAIYTFFEPQQQHRSLGAYAILWQIEWARELGLSYVYLGYWIRQCRKMAYKIDYRPLELYFNGRWSALPSKPAPRSENTFVAGGA